jgi:hypothetical protein
MAVEVRIGELVVPVAQAMNFADALAIERVTGMDAQTWTREFEERKLTKTDVSLTLTAGLLAWWVQHEHPRWSTQRVADLIRELDPEQLESLATDLDVPDPPAMAGPEPASDSIASSTTSTIAPNSDLGRLILSGIGHTPSPD